jgi:hypothetical protein
MNLDGMSRRLSDLPGLGCNPISLGRRDALLSSLILFALRLSVLRAIGYYSFR